jgi:hypothetical protein
VFDESSVVEFVGLRRVLLRVERFCDFGGVPTAVCCRSIEQQIDVNHTRSTVYRGFWLQSSFFQCFWSVSMFVVLLTTIVGCRFFGADVRCVASRENVVVCL